MDNYTATEMAYKNGYEKGYADGYSAGKASKKSQKVKPRKRKHKAITIETMKALEAMGKKAHGG